MSHIEYNEAAAQRSARADMIARAAEVAMAKNESQFSEGQQWCAYVFLYFVVTALCVYAVLSVLP